MFKCDKCNENYEFTPYVIRGKQANHVICPLCVYEFKKLVDKFMVNPEKKQDRRICGHKLLYTRHLGE